MASHSLTDIVYCFSFSTDVVYCSLTLCIVPHSWLSLCIVPWHCVLFLILWLTLCIVILQRIVLFLVKPEEGLQTTAQLRSASWTSVYCQPRTEGNWCLVIRHASSRPLQWKATSDINIGHISTDGLFTLITGLSIQIYQRIARSCLWCALSTWWHRFCRKL
jgi:hypothetical protein